jgi:hypothetical protein
LNALRLSLASRANGHLDYKDTAVKLQSEWDVEDPQKLDFAPNVKDHALVSILQRGLLYNEAERKAALVWILSNCLIILHDTDMH